MLNTPRGKNTTDILHIPCSLRQHHLKVLFRVFKMVQFAVGNSIFSARGQELMLCRQDMCWVSYYPLCWPQHTLVIHGREGLVSFPPCHPRGSVHQTSELSCTVRLPHHAARPYLAKPKLFASAAQSTLYFMANRCELTLTMSLT